LEEDAADRERELLRAAADVMVSAMIIEAEQALQFDTIDDVISDVEGAAW